MNVLKESRSIGAGRVGSSGVLHQAQADRADVLVLGNAGRRWTHEAQRRSDAPGRRR